jgi:lysozyme
MTQRNPNPGFLAGIFAAIAALFKSTPSQGQIGQPIGRTPAALKSEPKPARPARKTLIGIGVAAPAAAALFILIPKEESGRIVDAKVENGQVVAKHVRGPEHRTPYRDIVGVWTVCDGDTKNVVPGQVQTREQCMERLESELIAHTEPVLKCVPGLRAPERANQLIAAVSLAYNIGPGRERPAGVWTGGFCGSTAARRFNARDWRGGCDALLRFNKAGGRVVRGLTLRRERERAICLRGL